MWVVPPCSPSSELDRLRTGAVMISSPLLVHTLRRRHSVRELGIQLPAAARIPATRVAALARFAGAAKSVRSCACYKRATWPPWRHWHIVWKSTAQDDALEVLEALLRELYGGAIKGSAHETEKIVR
ncbi:hypothetical protein FUT69_04920 [Xylella taiwanensis]|nr:hypothetical protein [Xylella taiwanensis]AXI82780.1 hypothetical protein AB672_01775 [Xylella taiwanensis]EWS78622.1 hypothetical protein AF72_04545 [Xylella taiwanensis]MCD8458195.1 hypothetical protein [Xylella taiwanensis]MCD8460331.1 hypothetical protein [Xylella taiwanensis]MCD8467607.1 hypothetical protein [Xylella taiwanensis]